MKEAGGCIPSILCLLLVIAFFQLLSAKELLTDDTDLSTFFTETESVQIYHMLATTEVYEKGTLNSKITLQETALGFWSASTDVKCVLAFEPTDDTIQLLPVIDMTDPTNPQIEWDSRAAVYYRTEIDADVWATLTYMGTMGGSAFRYLAEYARGYARDHAWFQPFSAYDAYPGTAYVEASASDDFAWGALGHLTELGIELHPVVVPKKVKFVFYAAAAPQVVDAGASPAAAALVVDHFLALRHCLRTRPLERLGSLADFTLYYSRCLEDVAYLYKDGGASFYRLPLRTNIADDVDESEDLPTKAQPESGYTWVDLILILVIGMGFLLGIFLAMIKAEVIQHIKWPGHRGKGRHRLRYEGFGGGRPFVDLDDSAHSHHVPILAAEAARLGGSARALV